MPDTTAPVLPAGIELAAIERLARSAGERAMDIYRRDFAVSYKEDHSPLSEADVAVNALLCAELSATGLPLLSEENRSVDYAERSRWEHYWCIDPIDGTKEFIRKNDQWTINIALIHRDTPVLGVVYAPALDLLYSGAQGQGAWRNGTPLPLAQTRSDYVIVASRSHLNDETRQFIATLSPGRPTQFISMGSSLKLCLVASGEADCYPRLAPTMEWDTAAADAVVRCSGHMTCRVSDRTPLLYNKIDLHNPHFVVM